MCFFVSLILCPVILSAFNQAEPLPDKLLDILKSNPYQSYPVCEKLSGDLTLYYSRRINIQHRLVYQVFPEEKVVKVIRMWTHYE
ncbi:MAG: Txe/YoeB family addiction module toxin [Snowella sp.]|nr:MAG: Txe/YoeB family addiction module toxin [Snowella sp.]